MNGSVAFLCTLLVAAASAQFRWFTPTLLANAIQQPINMGLGMGQQAISAAKSTSDAVLTTKLNVMQAGMENVQSVMNKLTSLMPNNTVAANMSAAAGNVLQNLMKMTTTLQQEEIGAINNTMRAQLDTSSAFLKNATETFNQGITAGTNTTEEVIKIVEKLIETGVTTGINILKTYAASVPSASLTASATATATT